MSRVYSTRRTFPSKVNWRAFWRHRWIILDFINQVAHGEETTAIRVMQIYGGSTYVGVALKEAANDIIVKK